MRRIAAIVSLLGLAACGDPPLDGDAGPDASEDGGGGQGGLVITWTAAGIDEEVDGATVEQLLVGLRDLQVVGDAAGDETYLASRELSFEAPEGTDDPVRFTSAPPGRYSVLEWRVDNLGDDREAWRLRGEWAGGDGDPEPFEIEDEMSSTVSLPLDLTLAAGETRTIRVAVDVPAILAGVDWASLPRDDGDIVVEPGDPELAAFRARFLDAFSITSIE